MPNKHSDDRRMLGSAFKMRLRQSEGLLGSVVELMGLTVSAPDHATVNRPALTLPVTRSTPMREGPVHALIDRAGQWLEAKHGAKSRRIWRKLHLAIDAGSGMIAARILTDQDGDDPSEVGPLLDQIGGPDYSGDGRWRLRRAPTYRMIAEHGEDIEVAIPPRSTAVPGGEAGQPAQRDCHLALITEQGLMAWQEATDDGRRARIGPRLRVRGLPGPADRSGHRRRGPEACWRQHARNPSGAAGSAHNRRGPAGNSPSVAKCTNATIERRHE
jgi:Transposase DDE domain